MRSTLVLTLSLLFLAASLPLAAQSFNDAISVYEVEVPVQVRLGSEPLAGLTAEDFELYSDGELQEILSFEEIHSLPTERAAGRAETEAAASSERQMLMLFDLVFSQPRRTLRAIHGARQTIDTQLAPGDRVAVALYNGSRGVTLVTGFTDDRYQLSLALDVVEGVLGRKMKKVELAQAALLGLRTGSNFDHLTETLGWTASLVLTENFLPVVGNGATLGGGGVGFGITAPGRMLPTRSDSRPNLRGIRSFIAPDFVGLLAANSQEDNISLVRTFAQSLGDLATLLRDVPGASRHILLYSQGFPTSTMLASRSLSSINEMRHAFLRSGWALQAIDVTGVQSNDNNSLYYLANETGGELYQNYNRFDLAMEKFFERQRVSYRLSFRPQVVADGRGHQLKVRLTKPIDGAEVLHRPHFYAPKPVEKRSALERRLDAVDLLFSEAAVEELSVDAALTPDPRSSKGSPLEIEIDGASLLGEANGEEAVTVEIQGYALDDRGGVVDFFQSRFALKKSEIEEVRRDALSFTTDLDLPGGEHALRLLVRHVESGRLFLGTFTLESADPSA